MFFIVIFIDGFFDSPIFIFSRDRVRAKIHRCKVSYNRRHLIANTCGTNNTFQPLPIILIDTRDENSHSLHIFSGKNARDDLQNVRLNASNRNNKVIFALPTPTSHRQLRVKTKTNRSRRLAATTCVNAYVTSVHRAIICTISTLDAPPYSSS